MLYVLEMSSRPALSVAVLFSGCSGMYQVNRQQRMDGRWWVATVTSVSFEVVLRTWMMKKSQKQWQQNIVITDGVLGCLYHECTSTLWS